LFVFITGGAASGKSEIAEKLAVAINKGKMLYIATMYPTDEECYKRIDKHRIMRESKGFDTLECPYGLTEHWNSKTNTKVEYDTALLECMSNLVANEMYLAGRNSEEVIREINSGIKKLVSKVNNLIVVSNEIFSELQQENESNENESIQTYLNTMGQLNSYMATIADVVLESVCSIPVFYKGREELLEYENLL